jgi:hypothetical protein
VIQTDSVLPPERGANEAYNAQQAREAASDKNYNKVVHVQPIGTMTQTMRNEATGEERKEGPHRSKKGGTEIAAGSK